MNVSDAGIGLRRIPHAEFLDLPFCLLPQAEVVRLILAGGAPYRYVVTPNAHHVVTVHNQPARLLSIYHGAWLSLCDSRIVRALAKLDGHALPLVTGSDLVATLLATLNAPNPARPPLRLLIVGPPTAIATALREVYPNLTVDVILAPGGLANDAALRRSVAEACMDRTWDIALLCVGSPAQELVAQQLGELGCESGIALCVGASIDFLTGKTVRAPLWLQKLNLEWAYRLTREPKRLWRRYLVESPKIFHIFIAKRLARGY
jgi:N-acetylglucosaminyldiphosphoundecaprenol N-acetyl-beta-D-mannosaminyltransferase